MHGIARTWPPHLTCPAPGVCACARAQDGSTPLTKAACNGHKGVVTLLLAHNMLLNAGALVDTADNVSWVLCWAPLCSILQSVGRHCWRIRPVLAQ
jgi:hypothetical protein